jgi:hypothetical protein
MHLSSKFTWALAACAAAALVACGGSGGSGSTDASVGVTVVDGALRNAIVCLDKNLNEACDSGEPTGRTDASGKVTLVVPATDVGKYPVLAVVGTDAVDADHGAVATAFTLKAPADKTAVISPLTTLVQTTIEATGSSSSLAEATLKDQIGIKVSLFDDFTKNSSTDGVTLGAIARMVVVTTQSQTKTLASAVGTKAIDGSTISARDVGNLIRKRVLANLQTVVEQIADPTVQAAIAAKNPQQIDAALAPLVSTVTASTGLTTTSVATLVGIEKQATAAEATTTPVSGVNLDRLVVTDANNWFVRALTGSVAQNTPDSAGLLRYVDRRFRRSTSSAGVVAAWGHGNDPTRQVDFNWNGSAWVQCPLNYANKVTVRDAQGRATYTYCDNAETGISSRSAFDISGRTLLSVYDEGVAAGYTNFSIPNASSLLGSTVFPTGSKVLYQTNTPLTTAPSYFPGVSNIVRNTSAAVAAGKTTAADTTSACAAITPTTPQTSYTSQATTLESMVAANPGTPCVFQPNTTINVVVSSGSGTTTATVSAGPRAEWWGNSTVSLGTIGTVQTGVVQSPPGAYYTTNTFLRVAFAAGNVAKYYACQQRSTDGSPRNCDAIGTGTYTINTLGDARTMTLDNIPAQAASQTFQRVFVERGGKVYFGFQNKLTPTNLVRLNQPASNAVLSQLSSALGTSTIDPEVALAPTANSYQGDWLLKATSEDYNVDPSTTLRLQAGFSGSAGYVCYDNPAGGFPDTSVTTSCTISGFNPATGAATVTFSDGVATLNFDVNTGTATGSFAPIPSAPAVPIVALRR